MITVCTKSYMIEVKLFQGGERQGPPGLPLWVQPEADKGGTSLLRNLVCIIPCLSISNPLIVSVFRQLEAPMSNISSSSALTITFLFSSVAIYCTQFELEHTTGSSNAESSG